MDQTDASEKKESTDATQPGTSGNASTVTAPAVETVGSDSEEDQSVEQHDESSDNDGTSDDDEDMPRVGAYRVRDYTIPLTRIGDR